MLQEKVLSALLLILFFMTIGLNSRAQNPEVILNDIEADPGEIEVPLEMNNFTEEVNSFTFKFSIDTLHLEFIELNDITGFSEGNFLSFQDGSVLTIQWFNMNGYQPDGFVFNIVFEFSGNTNTEISFIESSSEVSYGIDPVSGVVFNNGLVLTTEPIPDPLIEIDSYDTIPGELAFSLDADYFAELVYSFEFNIEIENESLEFIELSNVTEGISEEEIELTQENNIISITYSTNQDGFFPQSDLFDLVFTYYGGFSCELIWQENSQVFGETTEIENVTLLDGSVTQSVTENTIALSSAEALPNTSIALPLSFQGTDFENTTSFDLTLDYDTDHLSFAGLSDQILDITVSQDESELTLTWEGSQQDLNSQAIASLNFQYITTVNTSINFMPGSFSSSNADNIIPVNYENSAISPVIPQDTVSIADNSMFTGQSVTLPVTTSAMEEVGEIELHVNFDSDKADFVQWSAEQLTGWTSEENDDSVIFYWSGDESVSEGNLLLLEFYYEQAGVANLSFGTNTKILNPDNSEKIVAYVDGEITQAVNDAEVILESVSECDNNLATVPVNLFNADPFNQIYFEIAYNDNVLQFNELQNIAPQLESYNLNQEAGLITFTWESDTEVEISGTLFELEFDYLGGYSLIDFSTGSQFFDVSGASVPVELTGGEVDCELDVNTLTVNQSGEGNILVSQNGESLDPDEGTTNQYTVLYGEVLNLEALPATGWSFQQWIVAADTILSNPYEITMDQSYQITAEFSLNNYSLTLFNVPSEAGIVFGEGTYEFHEQVQTEAIPYSGWSFLYWKDENDNTVSDDPLYTFEMPADDQELYAHYQVNSYNLTLSAEPADGGNVTGAGTYDYGSLVSIEAEPEDDYAFLKWTTETGVLVSEQPLYDFNMPYNNVHYVAQFETDVSVESSTSNNKLLLYPNPADEKLVVTLEPETEKINHIELRSLTGRRVKQIISPLNNMHVFSIQALSAGIYILQVNTGNESFNKKVIIR